MNSYAFYNGKFGKKDDITIPLSDRAIFFGDAVYDAAIGRLDKILWEDDHIERLLKNAKEIGISHKYTANYISSLLHEIGVRFGENNYFIYMQISRSKTERTHSAINCNANLLITIDPIEISKNASSLKLITVEDRRYKFCNIKTVNLLPAVLSMTKAETANADEAVFIKNGLITECSKSNISIIKCGRIITHPESDRILPGIARKHLANKCAQIGVPFEERAFTYKEMIEADEILVTSTTKLCKTVHEIDSIPVGNKSTDLARILCDMMYQDFSVHCLS